MHIFLIGFMGSGKTYTGKRLAALLERSFLDLDDCIEQVAGQTISEIFNAHGEAHFRELEKETLYDLATLPDAVISCGGGTPCFHNNIDWLNDHGQTVFLDVPESILIERLSQEFVHRPVLAGQIDFPAFIATKLAARRPFYEKARIHLRLGNPEAEVARLILDQLPGIQK